MQYHAHLLCILLSLCSAAYQTCRAQHTLPYMHFIKCIAVHALPYILCPTCIALNALPITAVHARPGLLRHTHTYECKILCNIGPGGNGVCVCYSLYALRPTKTCRAQHAQSYMLCPTCTAVHARPGSLRHTHTYECKNLCNIGPGVM
jgi:hypothetical protein